MRKSAAAGCSYGTPMLEVSKQMATKGLSQERNIPGCTIKWKTLGVRREGRIK